MSRCSCRLFSSYSQKEKMTGRPPPPSLADPALPGPEGLDQGMTLGKGTWGSTLGCRSTGNTTWQSEAQQDVGT